VQLITILTAGLTGVILAAPIATAQEKKPGAKPAKPVRAIRLTAAGMGGAPPTQEELEKRHAAKLADPWVKNANWITDYDEAKAAAAESDKQIFAYFTRSYAP
jgi:hypothetical protein